MTNPGGRRGFCTGLAFAALALAVHHPVAGFDIDGKAKV